MTRDASVQTQDSSTYFASKFILFQEGLDFNHVVVVCYGKQQSLTLQGCVPSFQISTIVQVVVHTLGSMVQPKL